MAERDSPLEELITPRELEETWKIARATQASLRHRRAIPFVMVGPRTPRYRRADLERWMAEHAVPMAPETEEGEGGGK